MPETQDSPRPAQRRRWRFLGRGLVAAAVAAALAWFIWNGWASHELHVQLAALRAAGYPTTLADLAPQPVPAYQNAGLIYQRLFTSPEFKLVRDEWSKLVDFEFEGNPCNPQRPAVVQARREFLARPEVRQVLDTLRQASQLPYCVFGDIPLNWWDKVRDKSSDWNQRPEWTKRPIDLGVARDLLVAQVQSSAESGRLSQSLDWIEVMYRIADQVASVPDFGYVIGASLYQLEGPSFFWRAAGSVDMPGNLTASLRDRLTSTNGLRQWRHGVTELAQEQLALNLGSRPYALTNEAGSSARDQGHSKPGLWQSGWNEVRDWLYWSPLGLPSREAAAAFGLKLRREELKEGARPLFQAKAPLEALDARAKLRPHVPEITAVADADVRENVVSELKAFYIALALKAYKHDKGVYPDNLDQLAAYLPPSLPINPTTGKPYVYQRQGEGFTIYASETPPVIGVKSAYFWKCDK